MLTAAGKGVRWVWLDDGVMRWTRRVLRNEADMRIPETRRSPKSFSTESRFVMKTSGFSQGFGANVSCITFDKIILMHKTEEDTTAKETPDSVVHLVRAIRLAVSDATFDLRGSC